MALPNLINAASPADADNPSAGAAQIRGLKQFLEDLFGLTDNTNYTVSPFSISTGGVLSGLVLANLAAITTSAESWIGPSSTTGIYFKGGKVGIGTITPGSALDVVGIINVSSNLSCTGGGNIYSGPGAVYFDGGYQTKIGATGTGNGQDMQFFSGGAERMRMTAAGSLNIGGTSSTYAFAVSSDSAGKPGVGGLWTVVSDERLKENIIPADLDRCWAIVKGIPLKYFTWKNEVYTDQQVRDRSVLGWIAGDVKPFFDKAVGSGPLTQADGQVIDDCQDLNSGQILAALYGAVQQCMTRIEALEAK
jgi:hypothetical protein